MKKYTVVILLVCRFAYASSDTISSNGINSAGLTVNGQPLNGTGTTIGQIEPGRPGKHNDPDSNKYNNFVNPFKVFDYLGGSPNYASSDDFLGPGNDAEIHAEWIASIMISTDTTAFTENSVQHFAPTGVSPSAKLLSMAAETLGSTSVDQQHYAVSSQAIVTYAKTHHADGLQNISAINMSFGNELPGPNPLYDGNSLITEYVDWSAKNDNILYVVAGNELDKNNNPLIGAPADNFNGLTVASSAKDAFGVYSIASSRNVYSGNISGGRTWVSLMAPGENIDVDSLGPTLRENRPLGGTSEAAPHVTSTVALLQQYGAANVHVGPDYRQHEVMKAILMNSADKLADDGTFTHVGGLLGMDRTVLDQNGNNWFQSPAYNNPDMPLDPQMGTGELDVKRAVKQLAAGEHHSFEVTNLPEVPVIGWDYGQTQPELVFGDHIHGPNIYRFNQNLKPGSFISITLAFDRTVEKSGTNGVYSSGDTFTPSSDVDHPGEDQLADLDLYLLPRNASSTSQAVAYSQAFGTVDHIFYHVPDDSDGSFEFWVDEFNDHIDPENYAVAWWAEGEGAISSGAGDMNMDDHIDAKDIKAMMQALANEGSYADSFGVSSEYLSLLGDMNGDGLFTNADLQYLLNFLKDGNGAESVPEPASVVLLAVGGLIAFAAKRRRD